MKKFIEVALVLSILLLTVSLSSAQAQTAYTSDPNITHFTAGITSYAALSNFNNSDGCVDGSAFTPTSSELAGTPCRVYNLPPSTGLAGLPGTNWILATFSNPVSRIVVFPNIDHYGSGYDGYQYQIYGSNDYGSSDSPHWTPLFDATSVNACVSGCVEGGTGEPFTLGTFTGTPPSTVNNVETGGCNPGPVNGPSSNCVGYEAQFNFGTAYKYYAFGASTVAAATSNTEQELSAVGEASTVTIQFTPNPGTVTKIATVGDPSDPAAQSLALALTNVTTTINVSVTFFYEPTDLSTGTHGVGIADGICEASANESTDFDCRLAGTFTYPDGGTLFGTSVTGDRLVPHIIPSHNFLGVWVRVIATHLDGTPAVAGTDYAFGVDWYYAWNTNPLLAPGGLSGVSQNPAAPGSVNPEYPAGWNNLNPQMYDRPGENVDIAFIKNITTYSKNCAITTCVGTADPGVGGHTITLNDVVAAAPPNPPSGTAPNTVELQVPVPGISPFPYLKALPMLVSFELEAGTTETPVTNALMAPHSVGVATLDSSGNNVPVQFPRGFPTTFTYNKSLKSYYIFLSPAPYALYPRGTVFTLQINSDLFPAPVTATFVVK